MQHFDFNEYSHSYGNKAANLVVLKNVCSNLPQELPFSSVCIPKFCPLSHKIIQEHLNKHAPLWQDYWKRFVQAQRNAKDQLSPNGISILADLRQLIINTFKNYPFNANELTTFLQILPTDKNLALMVRSSGKEDSIDLANPGGNESIAAVKPDTQSISTAIAQVVSSYFSEKSLSQRLLAGDNIINEPFMPVLIQHMIGEPVEIKKNASVSTVISGVMYTHVAGGTRIQLAPGHNDLVVNAKGSVDTFFITSEQVVHAEIYQKYDRLVPVQEIEEQKKEESQRDKVIRSLAFRKNPISLRDAPSVSTEIALGIAKVGELIKQHYGMPMDIEFVYDPVNQNLNIVQARPIVKSKSSQFAIPPSSISPEKIIEIKNMAKEGKIDILKAAVVTTNCASVVIIDASEIVIANNIGTALDEYLSSPTAKVVLVQEHAPDTSHEAAQFRAAGVSVLQVKDINLVRDLIKKGNPLIIDPQRNQILNWKDSSFFKCKSNEDIEKKLYDLKILEFGLFVSPFSPQKTLLPTFTKQGKLLAKKIKKTGRKLEFTEEKIGELIQRTNKGDEEACAQLMLTLFERLPEENELKIDLTHPYSFLQQSLEKIEAAKINDHNEFSFKALREILFIFYLLAESKKTENYRSLFPHAMIIGVEIYKSLLKYSSLTSPARQNDKREELLTLVAKLKALVISPEQQYLFSNSVYQVACESKEKKLLAKIQEMNPVQQAYFQQFCRLGKIALAQPIKIKWEIFVLFCCQQKGRVARKALAYLVKFAFHNKIESDWLHHSFNNAWGKLIGTEDLNPSPQGLQAVLKALVTECQDTSEELTKFNLATKQACLDRWEKKIDDWADPKKFDSLWESYEKELLPLIQELSWKEEHQPLTKKAIQNTAQRLAALIDKTIKSMKGSRLYETSCSSELRIPRFVKLLEPYLDLMEKWMNVIPDKQYDSWAYLIGEYKEDNLKKGMLNEIKNTFSKLKKLRNKEQLHPSGYCSVEGIKVGTTVSFNRQFVYLKHHFTLEDIFSLIHQNTIFAISFVGKDLFFKMEDFPDCLKLLSEALLGVKVMDSYFKRPLSGDVEIININHIYPTLQIEFNLPLRHHSSNFLVEFNQITQETTIKVNFFWLNGGYRSSDKMYNLVKFAQIQGKFLSVNLEQAPNFNEDTGNLSFKWKFGINKTAKISTKIQKILSDFADITYVGIEKSHVEDMFKMYSGDLLHFKHVFCNLLTLEERNWLLENSPDTIKHILINFQLEQKESSSWVVTPVLEKKPENEKNVSETEKTITKNNPSINLFCSSATVIQPDIIKETSSDEKSPENKGISKLACLDNNVRLYNAKNVPPKLDPVKKVDSNSNLPVDDLVQTHSKYSSSSGIAVVSAKNTESNPHNNSINQNVTQPITFENSEKTQKFLESQYFSLASVADLENFLKQIEELQEKAKNSAEYTLCPKKIIWHSDLFKEQALNNILKQIDRHLTEGLSKHLQSFYCNLLSSLIDGYKTAREENAAKYLTIFGLFFGYSKTKKIEAASDLDLAINATNALYRESLFKKLPPAARQGRLGKINKLCKKYIGLNAPHV